jgi:hypothetical protein
MKRRIRLWLLSASALVIATASLVAGRDGRAGDIVVDRAAAGIAIAAGTTGEVSTTEAGSTENDGDEDTVVDEASAAGDGFDGAASVRGPTGEPEPPAPPPPAKPIARSSSTEDPPPPNADPEPSPLVVSCPGPDDRVPSQSATAEIARAPASGADAYLVDDGDDSLSQVDWITTATDESTWSVERPLPGGWTLTSDLVLDGGIAMGALTFEAPGADPVLVQPLGTVHELVTPASPGKTWSEDSLDVTRRLRIQTTGRYVGRQAVPLCDELVEAWKVETVLRVEPISGLGGNITAEITAATWYATQDGGRIVRTEAAYDIDTSEAGLVATETAYLTSRRRS